MTSVTVRQSGGAEIVTIPKAIGNALGIKKGSKLALSIENGNIVLMPLTDEITLDMLLSGSPKHCFDLTEEDREWLDEPSLEREF
jgi:antitoxin ChpS